MTTLGNQIPNNIIDAMNNSDNQRTDEKGTKNCSHSKSFRDKSQIQEQRKIREVSRSESSGDEQFSSHNDDNEISHCHQKLK